MERDRKLLEKLLKYTVPELCDGMAAHRVMDWQIKPWTGRARAAGFALTVDVPAGEGGLVADAVEMAREGDVIVVAGKGWCQTSYWGDHRSLCARMNRAGAVVIDGAFRDLEGCEKAGFPVFARALTCRSAGKTGEGRLNVPVLCGGVQVCPGDLIAADVNGICVIKPQEVPEILERAERKVRAQARTVERMERTGKAIVRIRMEEGGF